jgi:hypothetical protein
MNASITLAITGKNASAGSAPSAASSISRASFRAIASSHDG